ncbi:MAG: type II/IV secretion system protein [Nitrosomonadales bacterium]|nr:type II/IV secretion system protein [Nitrosomonadales bacterium]
MSTLVAVKDNAKHSVITPQLIRDARAKAAQTHRSATEILESLVGLESPEFVAALGELLHYPTFSADGLNELTQSFDALSFPKSSELACLALRNENDDLIVIMSDPFNLEVQTWLEQHIQSDFSWGLAHRSDIEAYLAHHERSLNAMDSMQQDVSERSTADYDGTVEELSFKTINEETSVVVKLVQSTVYDALKAEASDIHLETSPTGLVIKYRIDGVLVTTCALEGLELAEQVISRIKVISGLDITERRTPQDGRFKVSVQRHEVDLRVSIMPSVFGECAVLRVLDKRALSDQMKGLRLDHLGFDEKSMLFIRRLSREPYGMILVTGPTGSGKTSTLYAALTEVNHGTDKIITIEDPVEYQLPGVLQIPVNEKKGLTFERGLRSILRHDPDKIMVGEIRDPETAQIAVQSALTGHLVFTTVHANNVFDVLGRFVHMGVDPYSFVSALNGVVAQRLVRVICKECITDDTPEESLILESGLTLEEVRHVHFRRGSGCRHCRGTGFKGRKAIAEILNLNDELRELIVGKQPVRLIREAARRNGTRLLREGALDLVFQGESTLEEANRVTFN